MWSVRANRHRRKTSPPEIAIVARYRVAAQAKIIIVPVIASLAYHGLTAGVKEAPAHESP